MESGAEPPILKTLVNRSRRRLVRSSSCFSLFRQFTTTIDPASLNEQQLQEIADRERHIEYESIADYGSKGYMPIRCGQLLGRKTYKIIRKFGYGQFSTVWLCHNKKNNTYEALKVMKSAFKSVALDEVRLLKSIMSCDPDDPGHRKIIYMTKFFTESSLNGLHACMTFEIMGPSLLELIIQSEYKGIQIDGVRTIIKQVLQGLVYLHTKCKIIHTDIKPENILICVKDSYIHSMVAYTNRYEELGIPKPKSYVSALEWKERIQTFGEPMQNASPNISAEDDHPSVTRYRSASHNSLSPAMPRTYAQTTRSRFPLFIDPKMEVKIADFGNSCWESYHYSYKIQTLQYRALEVILDAGYSYPADLWSVGCLAFELATGHYLFNPSQSEDITEEEDHLGLIWQLLGGIPSYVVQKGAAFKRLFDNTGYLRQVTLGKIKMCTLEERLMERYNFNRDKAIVFAEFIQCIIEPDPELRSPASLALKHPWIRET